VPELLASSSCLDTSVCRLELGLGQPPIQGLNGRAAGGWSEDQLNFAVRIYGYLSHLLSWGSLPCLHSVQNSSGVFPASYPYVVNVHNWIKRTERQTQFPLVQFGVLTQTSCYLSISMLRISAEHVFSNKYNLCLYCLLCLWHRVVWYVITNVSEEHTLNIAAVWSFEILVRTCQTTRCHTQKPTIPSWKPQISYITVV
jgi:hypothetical protein